MVLSGTNIAPVYPKSKETFKRENWIQATENKHVFGFVSKSILTILTFSASLYSLGAQAQIPGRPTASSAKTLVSARVNMSGSCASCDLSNRAMPKISLQGSNLSGSDFSRSNLSGGQFFRSNLSGANFRKAYLMRITGSHTNLHHAVLRDASLIEAELLHSDITQADLRRVDLTNGDFSHSRFDGSDMSGADAVQAKFVKCSFSETQLKRSDFTSADFTNASFINTQFGDANITEARFDGAQFLGADLSQTKGLTLHQLRQACGDDKTRLPDSIDKNFRLRECPPPKLGPKFGPKLGPKPALKPGPPSPSIMAFAPAATPLMVSDYQMAENRSKPQDLSTLPHHAKNISQGFMKSYAPIAQAATPSILEQAIAEIDATLRDLPLESPLYKRLRKSRVLLEQIKTSP